MGEKQECAFCGNEATTVEHVIPKWLQRHYDLYNKKLRVWTGDAINYRCATIPACQQCNGGRLANLEKRIQAGTASESDYYLWALKIRYGLSIMDSRLYIDPKDHDKGFLLPPGMKNYQTGFILPALASLDDPNFHFYPDPFGSVFLFHQEGNAIQKFDFAEVPYPYMALAIVIPPDKVLAVLLADRGVVKSVIRKCGGYETLVDIAKSLDLKQLLFYLIRIQLQIKIPGGFSFRGDAIYSQLVPDTLPTRIPKLKWYDDVCELLGMSKDFGNSVYYDDIKTATEGFVNWRV